MKLAYLVPIALACAAAADKADEARALPDGSGKEIAGRVCIDCHDSGNFRRARFTADQWADSVADMIDRGAKATPSEIDTLVAYLAKNFGKESPVQMNTAPLAEIKVVLGFTVAESRALIDYREKNGPFKNADDLLKVPGIDPAKVAAQKSLMVF
jgi:competence protein ComEA